MKTGLALLLLFATAAGVVACSDRNDAWINETSDAAVLDRAASYLELVQNDEWQDAWGMLTQKRRRFWSELAQVLSCGGDAEGSDLVIRSLRSTLSASALHGTGYDLFKGLAKPSELMVSRKLVRTGPTEGRPSASRDEDEPSVARVQIPEHGVDMRMRYLECHWLVDSIAFSDLRDSSLALGESYAHPTIDGWPEEVEIFITRKSTVRLPAVSGGNSSKPGSDKIDMFLDSAGSSYFKNSFIPRDSWFVSFSSLADLKRDDNRPDHRSEVVFSLQVSAEARWEDAYELLAQMARAKCRHLLIGVEPSAGLQAASVRMELMWGSDPEQGNLVVGSTLITTSGFSPAEMGNVARLTRIWSQRASGRAVEVTFAPSCRWQEALKVLVLVGRNAPRALIFARKDEGVMGVSVKEVRPRDSNGTLETVDKGWLPLRVALAE